MLFMPYTQLYRSLLCAQHCCHLLVGTVVNKIKESRHSKEYYPKNGIKSLKRDKIGDKISPGRKSYFGDSPRKSGTNRHLTVRAKGPVTFDELRSLRSD